MSSRISWIIVSSGPSYITSLTGIVGSCMDTINRCLLLVSKIGFTASMFLYRVPSRVLLVITTFSGTPSRHAAIRRSRLSCSVTGQQRNREQTNFTSWRLYPVKSSNALFTNMSGFPGIAIVMDTQSGSMSIALKKDCRHSASVEMLYMSEYETYSTTSWSNWCLASTDLFILSVADLRDLISWEFSKLFIRLRFCDSLGYSLSTRR